MGHYGSLLIISEQFRAVLVQLSSSIEQYEALHVGFSSMRGHHMPLRASTTHVEPSRPSKPYSSACSIGYYIVYAT
jgi:hypothetical protein